MKRVAAWTAIVSGGILLGLYLGFLNLVETYAVAREYQAIFVEVVPTLGAIEILAGMGLLLQKSERLQAAMFVGLAVVALLVTAQGLKQLPTGREYGSDVSALHPLAASWGNGTPTDELNRTFMEVAAFIEHVIKTKGAERKLQEAMRRQQQSYEHLRFSTPPADFD